MIVFGNSTNLRYQSPSAALLHKPKPLLADSTISIPLPPSDPQYDTRGRQRSFDETLLQRLARVEFIQQRTGKRRVEEWVRSQMQSSPLFSLPEIRSQPSPPQRHRSMPRRKPTRKAYVSSPLSSSCVTCDSDPQIAYAVPEDSEEPQGYREPYIFYSSSQAIIAPTPTYPSSPILESPESPVSSPSPSSTPSPTSSPRRARHRRRLSDLDDIAEEED